MQLFENGPVVSVSTLITTLRDVIEDNFVDVVVRGELSNVSTPASGHIYFSLKDSRAQLRCAMFRAHARLLRCKLENGQAVICCGRLSVYPQRGDLQLIVDGLEPEGVGTLQLAFDQLKARLQQEGLFNPEHKQELPAYPRVIGVVTSATGAALQDILTILKRRGAGVKVLLRPVLVQGDDAAADIAAAIAELNRHGSADVLIVGRGGGSREDLWAFNEEQTARAIYTSTIPVISAVGHESDFSIADMVADLRAATPSAAAELVVRHRLEMESHLDQLVTRLSNRMSNQLELLQSRLSGLEKRLKAPQEQLQHQQIQLRDVCRRLNQGAELLIERNRQALSKLSGRLDALSPLKVLSRGYAIASTEAQGTVLTNAADVGIGDRIKIKLAEGQVKATVTERNCDG